MFEKVDDYAAFEKVLEEAGQRAAMRLLGFCVMPNHWHLVLWPRQDGDLAELKALRRSACSGTPFGDTVWQQTTAKRLGLESTLRSPGRPKSTKPHKTAGK